MFLVVVDSHTKLLEVFQMQKIKSRNIFERPRSCFTTHGLPDCIVSNNGPTFTSDEFREFTSANGTRHIFAAPYQSSIGEWLSGESGSVIQGSHETYATCTIAVVLDAMACKLSADPALNHESFTCCNVAAQRRRPKSRFDLILPNTTARVEEKQ